ncbi:tetratricopeptide repeat protein [Alistipes indistinctus]|uniref:tetratricopeptide repeat protein n=1 Tax=Alistipes indistinctus TaxID=626932 RepID=UPI003F01F076
MKRNIQYITLFSAALGLLAGCASSRHAGRAVTATPAPYMLTPDSADRVQVDMAFHIPGKYFSKRSRLIILPRLMVDDTVKAEFAPLVVDAPIYDKKITRRRVLDNNYTDPHESRAVKPKRISDTLDLPYKTTMQLPAGTDRGRVVAVVTTDGCGECTGRDTVDVAAISHPVTLIDEQIKESLQLSWIEPEFVVRPKVMEGRGTANLQFVINKSDINLSMGNNRQELNGMLEKLSPVMKDSLATLNRITITGMASVDGSLAFNTALAKRRAAAARWWLIAQLEIPSADQKKLFADSRPEGWEPVLAAMIADNNPDSAAVQAILEQYADQNDDVQERYIRRLPCWNMIKTKYLQNDRKVEYVYTYTLKSFTTDAELLDMYGKRPDVFNEDELLRVAVLVGSPEEKKEVYRTLMKYFPQSKVAANNLAVLYLHEGKEDEARAVLAQQGEYTPEMLNTLASSYVYAGEYEKAVELLQRVDLPEARYNLGLLKAQRRELREAYELLRPFGDVNSAIMALSMNRNAEAEAILSALEDASPVAEYARSMTAARQEKDEVFYRHIGNACGDEALRLRAASEADFMRYNREDKFRAIINR